MRILHYIALMCLLAASAPAQIFAIAAGRSTLYDAQGVSIKSYLPNATTETGVGFENGRLVFGFNGTTTWRQYNVTAGDMFLPLALATDNHSYYDFGVRGIEVSRKFSNQEAMLFVGADRESLTTPFLPLAGHADVPLMMLQWKRQLSDRFTFTSDEILSGHKTALQGLEFRPRTDLSLGLVGGLGNNKEFIGSSVKFTRPWLHLYLGYSLHDAEFRRSFSRWPLVTEASGANAEADVTPMKRLHVYASHQNLLAQRTRTSVFQKATADSLGGAVSVSRMQFNSTVFSSKYSGRDIIGLTVGGGVNIGRVQMMQNWYRSAGSSSLITTLNEKLTRHFTASETVTQSGGSPSFSFGGSMTTNLVSISVQHQTVFLPFAPLGGSAFHQVLVIGLRLQLPHNVSLNANTLSDFLGRNQYSLGGNTYVYGHRFENIGAPGMPHQSIGRYVVRGRVIDKQGNPVAGAAVQVGKDMVWTDNDGAFEVRTRKPGEYEVRVRPDSFMQGGVYKAVGMPQEVISVREGEAAPDLTVVVERQ